MNETVHDSALTVAPSVQVESKPQLERKQPRPRGTGSLYRQKGRSTWWMKYYQNGKPFSESTGTEDQRLAERKLQRKLREIAAGEFIEPTAESTTIKQLADEYLRDYRINKRKSM